MTNYEAIGLIEVKYFTIASQLLDAVCKGTNVTFLSSENYLGGRLVTLVIGGGISDVKGALELVKNVSPEITSSYLKGAILITNPAKEIMDYLVWKKEEPTGETLNLKEDEEDE
ncbi:BMC domain-containing protein [Salipaludibacillus daqingensis]|uniref:BMC domain-containing protein n=1 Tax=Salipaludibacillus daqingensis TaxID=3041001 RepID=UPI0024752211|nr:BMC domain-containing protein [Salipaludibacillus daqingensis]